MVGHDRPHSEEPGAFLQLAKQEFVPKHRIILFCRGMGNKGSVDPTPFHFFEKIFCLVTRFDIFLAALAYRRVTINIQSAIHPILVRAAYQEVTNRTV
jgi:hypothetical protein